MGIIYVCNLKQLSVSGG